MRRRNWTILAIAAGLVLAGSLVEMARRVIGFNTRSQAEIYVFNPVSQRRFEFAGRSVSLEEVKAKGEPRGERHVELTYGGESVLLRQSIEGIEGLPGLASYEDWLAVLRFMPLRGRSLSELLADVAAGRETERLVVVTRTPRTGAPVGSWGDVWRHAWVFDFYELLPEDGIRHERLRFPESEMSLFGRQMKAKREGREPIERAEDELKEGTWQFQAALFVSPKGRGPRYSFTNDAVRAMGWTFPAAVVSVLVLILSVAFAAAPRSRRART